MLNKTSTDPIRSRSIDDWGSGGRWFESSHPDQFLQFRRLHGNTTRGAWRSLVSNVAPFPLPAVPREPKRRTKRRILNASTLKALVPPPTRSVDHFE